MKRILLVEDVASCRIWLRDILRAAFDSPDITEACNLRAAMAALQETFDLVLLDLYLPDGDGLDFLRQLRARDDHTLCVVTTAFGDDGHIVGALACGADGYLLKDQSPELVTRQLRQIDLGLPALSPPVARRIMEHFRLTGPVTMTEHNLTPRERDVLALIGRGLRNGEVARELGLSENTVAGYIKSVYRKLGISSRAEAAWHSTRLGLWSQG